MQLNKAIRSAFIGIGAGLLASGASHAQFAVIDAASVAQLAEQSGRLAQELATARAQLLQLQTQYQSMTGSRGMQNLLAGSVRNYLPGSSEQLSAVQAGEGGMYGSLARAYAGNLQNNAVLTSAELNALPADARAEVQAQRAAVAMRQTLAQQALATTSARFGALQQLINALPSATDTKGVLDLQARIGAEQGMLLNEQNKLQTLFQMSVSQDQLLSQREQEQILAAQGQFIGRFEPTPR
jgi:type IV secretion system protein VirB5